MKENSIGSRDSRSLGVKGHNTQISQRYRIIYAYLNILENQARRIYWLLSSSENTADMEEGNSICAVWTIKAPPVAGTPVLWARKRKIYADYHALPYGTKDGLLTPEVIRSSVASIYRHHSDWQFFQLQNDSCKRNTY